MENKKEKIEEQKMSRKIAGCVGCNNFIDGKCIKENKSNSCLIYHKLIEFSRWKNNRFQKKLREYFSQHIVPNGNYNMELADDFIRFNDDKQKVIDDIMKTFNEF